MIKGFEAKWLKVIWFNLNCEIVMNGMGNRKHSMGHDVLGLGGLCMDCCTYVQFMQHFRDYGDNLGKWFSKHLLSNCVLIFQFLFILQQLEHTCFKLYYIW